MLHDWSALKELKKFNILKTKDKLYYHYYVIDLKIISADSNLSSDTANMR